MPLHGTGNTDNIRDDHPPTPRPSRPPDSLPYEPTRPQDKATFGNELKHHCLLYGPDATSFIQDSSVPFLSAWNGPFQMMKSCQATKILSPQEQLNLLHDSRWALTRSWYIIWLMFKKLPLISARHQKGGLLHLLRQTVPTNIFLLVHLCRSGSASTTGPWAPTRKGRCLRKANRAYRYPAGSI